MCRRCWRKRAPLLAVLNTSPDFRPAYDPLVRMAEALARTDPAAASALLDELARSKAARSETRVPPPDR
jgi:spermidine synthase